MADSVSNMIKELIGFIREVLAIMHYFSDLMAVISLHNMIFDHGVVGTIIIWVITALISGVIAELLKSHIPTPLRIILHRRGNL
jgi:hypothetical protein